MVCCTKGKCEEESEFRRGGRGNIVLIFLYKEANHLEDLLPEVSVVLYATSIYQ